MRVNNSFAAGYNNRGVWCARVVAVVAVDAVRAEQPPTTKIFFSLSLALARSLRLYPRSAHELSLSTATSYTHLPISLCSPAGFAVVVVVARGEACLHLLCSRLCADRDLLSERPASPPETALFCVLEASLDTSFFFLKENSRGDYTPRTNSFFFLWVKKISCCYH